MQKRIFPKLEKIIGELKEFPVNNRYMQNAEKAVENILISTCLSFISGHINRENIPSTDPDDPIVLENLIPEKIAVEYPIPKGVVFTGRILREFISLSDELGYLFSGVLFEYFLESKIMNTGSRKKSGAYYTPIWVVKDIVDMALKPILSARFGEFKTASDNCDTCSFIGNWDRLCKFRILDPACGWGIFLVEIFIELERFYKSLIPLISTLQELSALGHFDLDDMFSEEYIDLLEENNIISEIKKICQFPARHILKYHIRGFDIDSSSVRNAGNLLLSVASKNGNNFLDILAEISQVDFLHRMENPLEKYDLILGNPPYFTIGGGGRGRQKTSHHDYLKKHPLFSKYFRSQSDIFYYFIIGGINILKPGGTISYIIPSYWLDNYFADSLRRELTEKCIIEEIIDFFPHRVFETVLGKQVGNDSLILRASRRTPENRSMSFPVYSANSNNKSSGFKNGREFLSFIRSPGKDVMGLMVNQDKLGGGKWILTSSWEIFELLVKDGREIFPLGNISTKEQMKFPGEFNNSPSPLEGICKIGQGQETGLSDVFVVSDKDAENMKLEAELLKPNIKNRNIRKYYIDPPEQKVIMIRNQDNIEKYPEIKKYLLNYKTRLEARQRVKRGVRKWFAISIPQNYEIFDQIPKILVPYRAAECRFAIDRRGYFNDGGDVRAIVIKPGWQDKITYDYLLALLNSQLVLTWFKHAGKRKGNVLEFFTRPLSRIPVKIPDLEIQREISSIVGEITDILTKKSKSGYREKIESFQNTIDKMVFDIYGIPKNCRGDE